MKLISRIALLFIYAFTIAIVTISRVFGRKKVITNRVIINGTFHNPNWFHAHVEPISKSEYGEVILVTDYELEPLPNLVYKCPPLLLSKLVSRAGAKFLWTIFTGIRYPADLYIGYHIFPSGITALIASALLGSRCCYQVTSGPLELKGGGYAAENRLLAGLGTPSTLVEKFVNKVVRLCDLVIVRGSDAAEYVSSIGYGNNLEVVTGSVLTDSRFIRTKRDIDVIFVGRLVEYKRPDMFLSVIEKVVKAFPNINVKMAGDGPMMTELQDMIAHKGLSKRVEMLGIRKDIPELLGRSKILVLTSRWEGVSIAMLEGMALGVVPIVVNTGDLKDFVKNEQTGFISDVPDIEAMSSNIQYVLSDDNARTKLSENARQVVMEKCDRDVLSMRWKRIIESSVK